ncbi:MAG: SlyX family protein [Treponema sp.]|nr:SlyX family protein [Treponema sp.]
MKRPRKKTVPHRAADPQGLVRMEARVEKIETKLAYLEDFLDRLHGTLLEGNQVLELLKGEQRVIKGRLWQLSQEWESLPHKKPPHY